MGVPFATEAWIKALQTELNKSEGYREAASTWEGDFYFVVTAGAASPPTCICTWTSGMANAARPWRSATPPPKTLPSS
jgi:hypothetical protein